MRVRIARGVRDDGLEHVAHVEVVRVPLVVKNVAAGDGGLIQMPDQDALVDRQRLEPVGVQLHDRRFVDPFEQVLAFESPTAGRAASRPALPGSRPGLRESGDAPEHDIDMAATVMARTPLTSTSSA